VSSMKVGIELRIVDFGTFCPLDDFLTGASRRDHISPVLRSLHWLPVKQRVDYKLATLVHKSLRGQAPSYLIDDCQLIADTERPQLRSAHANILCSENKHSTLRPRLRVREFATVYPPHCGRLTIEFGHFKRLLKAFLFGETVAH